jgi:magnesium-transporting ATPase (P-type)
MDAPSPPTPAHALPPDRVLAALDSRPEGLSAAEAARRLARHGANVLPQEARKSLAAVVLGQFMSLLIYLLLGAAALSAALGDLPDTGFILAVLILNAAVGATQEWRAEDRAQSLRAMLRQHASVRRDGARLEIDAAELVPGDIVLVESGMQVPADLRLIEARGLSIDEALLTGESTPVDKDAVALAAADASVADRSDMLHAGSIALAGRGVGVATATGLATELGRIARALTESEATEPPLMARMRAFTRDLGFAIMGVIALLALVQAAQGQSLAEILLIAVALAVSAIPEGLPVALTVALSIAIARMGKRNVIVRRLPAVEGLGSCTLIASDKTGTLTRNELVCARLWLPGVGALSVSGEGYAPEGEATRDGAALTAAELQAARELAQAGAICNEASLMRQDGGWRPSGDTVDAALLALAGKLGLSREALLEERPQTGVLPYEPENRYAASFHAEDGGVVAFVKGAVETVLEMCGPEGAAEAQAAADELAAQGHRVLAAASGAASGPDELRRLRFLGLYGLIDPPRAEAAEAVRRCHAAGVEVRMVTGDHPLTALAVARELAITERREQVVTGAELARLDPAAFAGRASEARVFARIEPTQKQLRVQARRRYGHVVAVTGDGVNDAPALHAADIGVAMGRGGTDVARGAASLILADDNFASIVAGIEEGRIAWDNIRKVVAMSLATGAAEIVLFVLSTAAGLPPPLGAAQLLWLNLVTNGVQDVALAFEKGEPGVLDRPPRPPGQGVFDRLMVAQTTIAGLYGGALAFGFWAWALSAGWSEFEARNALLWLLVFFENAHVMNCRSETRSTFVVPLAANRFLLFGVLTAQGLHVAAMFMPGLSGVLEIAPQPPEVWLPVALLALTAIPVMEAFKWAWRRLHHRGAEAQGS